MKNMDLLEAFSSVDEKYLNEAEERANSNAKKCINHNGDCKSERVGIMDEKKYIQKKIEPFIAVAASVILCVGTLAYITIRNDNDTIKPGASISESQKSDSSETVEWDFSKQIARQINDDGWVYTFEHFYMKEQTDDEDIIPFTFSGINLRYVYNDYGDMAWQLGGENRSDAEKADMEKIADLLDYQNHNVTADDLKDLDADDIELSVIDENMFVDLVHQALEGEPHKESSKYLLPTYAILAEQEFIDNYKFQIGFLSEMGCIDVIYIDVLYKPIEGNYGYIQLSDMIDANSASAEQISAFNLISDISQGIVDNNDLMYDEDEHKHSIIGDIDFSRLYAFLEDIGNNDYMMYIIE